MGTEVKKSTRRNWSPEETNAFLDAYSKRQAEFQHTRKKKFAMNNVLEDLLAQGVLSQPTTAEMLNIKLKNLLRAFKATADNNNRTGETASKAPFEEKMEEIFGSKPEMRNNHTINLSGKAIDALPERNSSGQLEPLSESPSHSSDTEAGTSLGKRKYISYREKRLKAELDIKRKAAAERNRILADYAAKKIKKMEDAEKGKEERYLRKERLLRELFQNQTNKKQHL